MRQAKMAAVLAAAVLPFAAFADATVWLDELPLDGMECDWGTPQARKSVEGRTLSIGGKKYGRGVGTHAESFASYKLGGQGVSFEAEVGIDDEVAVSGAKDASVRFSIVADGKTVASTGVLKAGAAPVRLAASLAGVKTLELAVDTAGDGDKFDHADWADARFTMKDGCKPVPENPSAALQLGILTPAAPAAPRINGPRVFGVRPGSPIVWRLPVSGERPLVLSAEGLPEGATFDAQKGVLGGSVAKRGTYSITFTARNAKGTDSRALKLVVGDRIALTPPMGWNSWNCFASAVTEKNIRDTIDVLDKSGLADHGWAYVNIDDYWQNKPSAKNDETLQGPERNPDGSIAVNKRFGDMKALADYAHSKGLKIGLYSSPGPYTCGKCVGSWKHEWQDAATYAAWGFDYLKYDWCSYGGVAVGSGNDRLALPYRLMGEALLAQKRDIVFSLCQYGMGFVSAWGATTGGNCWRTTGDITDTYNSMWTIIHRQADSWPYARPGAWNDPDMLVVGRLGWGRLRPTRLAPNEQYTHMSLWAVCCSPLLIGCDMTRMDAFTKSLLTNDEVIETNQDELGAQAAIVDRGPRAEVWAKPMSDGSVVFALVNTHRFRKTRITADFDSLGLAGRWKVRDLWAQKDLGFYSSRFAADVPPRATTLVRLFPQDGAGLAPGLKDIRHNSTYMQFREKRPVDKPGYMAPAGYPCAECPRERH